MAADTRVIDAPGSYAALVVARAVPAATCCGGLRWFNLGPAYRLLARPARAAATATTVDDVERDSPLLPTGTAASPYSDSATAGAPPVRFDPATAVCAVRARAPLHIVALLLLVVPAAAVFLAAVVRPTTAWGEDCRRYAAQVSALHHPSGTAAPASPVSPAPTAFVTRGMCVVDSVPATVALWAVGGVVSLAPVAGLLGLLLRDPGIVCLPRADRGKDDVGLPVPPPTSRTPYWHIDRRDGSITGLHPPDADPAHDDVVRQYGKYCRTCRAMRAPRTAHCGVCDVEVAGFDHHCGVTNTCVGRGNLRAFLSFVWGVTALCDTVLVYVAYAFFGVAAGIRNTGFQVACIGLWIAGALSATHLNLFSAYYVRLYVNLGVTLRDHRKKGGVWMGRDLATRYESDRCGEKVDCSNTATCVCCCPGEEERAGLVPRPFHRGCVGNAAALCCPPGPCGTYRSAADTVPPWQLV